MRSSDAIGIYFNRAADQLDLSADMRRLLLTAKREVQVQIPIERDSGELATFIGYPPIAMGLEAWMANNLSHAPMQSTPLPSKAGDDWAFPPMELQLLSMVRNTIVPSAAIAVSLKTTAEGNLLESGIREYSLFMIGVTFNAIKRREAQSRLAALKRSERSAAAADIQQQRASLVGDSSKWRITNLKTAAKAMASWQ